VLEGELLEADVSRDGRNLCGIVVPYGISQEIPAEGITESFEYGAFRTQAAKAPDRVQLTHLHSSKGGYLPLGRAVVLREEPTGLYAEFRRHDRFHPILEGNGGFVVSTEPIPEQGVNATGINFIFNGGVGLRWNTRPRNAVTAGYRWVHVSNAETTTNNPGLDNNVFYLAYSFLR